MFNEIKINQFLKFDPILKDKIWGGSKLSSLLGKKSTRDDIGESWEISDVENDTSIVSNGALKGVDLKELIAKFKGGLVGEKIYKHLEFKLLALNFYPLKHSYFFSMSSQSC